MGFRAQSNTTASCILPGKIHNTIIIDDLYKEVYTIGTDRAKSGHTDDPVFIEIAPDIQRVPMLIVNIYLIGEPGAGSGGWVLIDSGTENSTGPILEASQARFGRHSIPGAIILTHGHFDHVGAVIELAHEWDVLVYAHPLEIRYLTGQRNYPPADPTVDEGLVSLLSPFFPHNSIDLHKRIRSLPLDGSVPCLPDWSWIHTPGHTPGHISLFRDEDGVLLAGDAFTTVKQESATAVLTQRQEVHGPPAYFTTDWDLAWQSVKRLEALHPSVVATGHGVPMKGKQLQNELEILVRDFDRVAMPEAGRYVH
ncbi:MAG: MBL fold metallo-hydrolase [Acidobacteriota bacterium]